MILLSFVLNSKIKKETNVANILDLREHSCNPTHYDQYPWPITYRYNSRGYRGQEWPGDLHNAIWCFGDSFTVGLGSPLDHTWCHCLQQLSKQRIINISMDGASNNWIVRKIQELLIEVVPHTIVIQWSYAHRREASVNYVRKLMFFKFCQKWDKFYSDIRDSSWPDASLVDFYNLPQKIQDEIRDVHCANQTERLTRWLDCLDLLPAHDIHCANRTEILTQWIDCSDSLPAHDDEARRLHYDRNASIQDDINNVIECINQIESLASEYNMIVIHSFIPDFIKDNHWGSISQAVPANRCVEPFKKLDLARDGIHYDIITATYVAEKINRLIGLARNS